MADPWGVRPPPFACGRWKMSAASWHTGAAVAGGWAHELRERRHFGGDATAISNALGGSLFRRDSGAGPFSWPATRPCRHSRGYNRKEVEEGSGSKELRAPVRELGALRSLARGMLTLCRTDNRTAVAYANYVPGSPLPPARARSVRGSQMLGAPFRCAVAAPQI